MPQLRSARCRSWQLYACMYVCMYVCVRRVCMCVFVRIYGKWKCLYFEAHSVIHGNRTYVCMYACMHVGMYVCMYVCMYTAFSLYSAETHDSGTRHLSRSRLLQSQPTPCQRRLPAQPAVHGMKACMYVCMYVCILTHSVPAAASSSACSTWHECMYVCTYVCILTHSVPAAASRHLSLHMHGKKA